MVVSAPVFCPRFIDRESELGLLRERYREASVGIGSTVLVSGDPGIGKSRLLAAARSEVEASGGLFAIAQCLEHSSAPLAPFTDLLTSLDAERPSALGALPALRRVLEDLVPAFGFDAQLRSDRRGLHNAIVDALRAFGVLHPTMIAIDDAQWADHATAELLPYLAARIDSSRLTLVVTYRSEEVAASQALAAAIPKIGGLPRTWHVRLGPLHPRDMQALVVHALGGRSGVDRAQQLEVVELAEGNPLFAEELLRDVVEAGQSGHEDRRLPLSVQASVRARTATFDRSDRVTLACAAAIGRRFDVALLAKVTQSSPERITALMGLARNRQLIQPDPFAAGVYVFRHAVVQEALHAELLPDESRALHQTIATELEQTPQTDERDVALAHHWWVAGDVRKGASTSEIAGDIAARRFAHHDAARMYERALAVAEPDSSEQALLFEKLGNALSAATPGQRSADAFQRAFAYWERAGEPAKCAALSLELAQQAWMLSQPDASLAWRKKALEATVDFVDHPLRFAALASMVFHHALAGDPAEAQRYVEEAEAFRGTPPAEPLAIFHTFRGLTRLLRGEIQPMLEEIDRCIDVATSPSAGVHALVIAYCGAGYRALNAGDLQTAERMFDSAIGTARERFVQDFEAYDFAGYALLMFLRGEWARARSLILTSATLSADSNVWWIEMQQVSVAIPLALRTGDDELLERFANEEIVEAAFRTQEPRSYGAIAAAFAELYAARGDATRAAAVLHRAVEATHSIGQTPALGIAIARFGMPADLARTRELYSRWAGPGNRAGAAYLALFDAIVAVREAREGVAQLGADAAARFAELGFPYAEACGLEIAGKVDAALSIFRSLGAIRDVERLERRLLNRRGRATNELTKRELDIAVLLGEGASNRRIAEALTLSERTVEHHVASILAKLGVESRAQIAAVAARGGIAQRPQP